MEKLYNTIICGDAIEEMKKLPTGSIDIVVTSPPYNLRNTTGGTSTKKRGLWKKESLFHKRGYASHSDNMPYDEYIKWQRECLSEMMRLIPNDGAIFYNHKWRVQKGVIQDRREIIEGFPVRQIIIWDRNSGHNFNSSYFLPTYEVIYMIAKPDFRLKKGGNSKKDIWRIMPSKNENHPATFPVELIDNILSSVNGQVVLDPFIGSGSTAISCLKNDKIYIGIEIEPIYVELANKKINDYLESI